jgi:hypothetical protein
VLFQPSSYTIDAAAGTDGTVPVMLMARLCLYWCDHCYHRFLFLMLLLGKLPPPDSVRSHSTKTGPVESLDHASAWLESVLLNLLSIESCFLCLLSYRYYPGLGDESCAVAVQKVAHSTMSFLVFETRFRRTTLIGFPNVLPTFIGI